MPASERVPASNGGPSVPTSFNSPAAPTRIPFKLGLTNDDEPRAKPEPWLTKESFGHDADSEALPPPKAPEPEPTKSEVKITLPLKPILNALPPFQLTGDISGVPEDATIELPFALVEPQLAAGRISVKPEQFEAALPTEYRSLFSSKDIAAAVVLPLQDVLKNLPAASLRIREDQEEQEKGESFATPFSTTAEEDARRFNVSGAPVAKLTAEVVPEAPVATAPAPAVAKETPATKADAEATPARNGSAPKTQKAPVAMPVVAAPETKAVPAPVAAPAPERTTLQELLGTDDDLDAKTVAARVEKFDGVKACAIMFSDGLNLAGKLPASIEADGLCAMAPSLLQRIENHMVETKLGALRAMTLSCSEAAVTFFMQDNLCLAALHSKEELASDVRERLARAVRELSKKYSNPV